MPQTENTRPSGFYCIRSVHPELAAGAVRGGRQVLIGLAYPSLVAFYFAEGGEFDGADKRPAPRARLVDGRPDLWSHDYEQAFTGALRDWRSELGFVECPIRVRRFNAEGVRIEDHPPDFAMFSMNPEKVEPDERDRQRMFERIECWNREGMFVLYWGKDYWMHGDGTVEST